MDSLDFTKLDYGLYLLNTGELPYTENVRYAAADFMKLNVRKIRLPSGMGNIVYLLTDTFENAIQLIKSDRFIVVPTYRRLFYPPVMYGSLFGRRYRFNLIRDRIPRSELIKSELQNIRLYPGKDLPKNSNNIFIPLGDIYAHMKPIMERYPAKKLYIEYMKEFIDVVKKITPPIFKETDNPEDNNRVLIIDADTFRFDLGGSPEKNKTNPLFLLYLAYIRDKDLSKYDIDQDMLICSKNMFMKFNPKMMTTDKFPIFRRGLFKIMNADLDKYAQELPEDDKEQLKETERDKKIDKSIDNRISHLMPSQASQDTKEFLKDSLKQSIAKKMAEKEDIGKIPSPPTPLGEQKPEDIVAVKDKDVQSTANDTNKEDISKDEEKTSNLFDEVVPSDEEDRDIESKTSKNLDDTTEKDIEEEEEELSKYDDEVDDSFENDEDVKSETLDEIQDKIIPLNNKRFAPINSERDKKLREEQRRMIIKNETIEQILSRDTSTKDIETVDKSHILRTVNKNFHKIKFSNFERSYLKEMYTKDLTACFDSLKDKTVPFYITSVDIKDTSTSMDLKETWSVTVVTNDGKRSTIKVDVPKFYNDRFMLIGGNKYLILKQNFYNPLVKDTPDTVILTTNFNKVTITRKSNKSLSDVERIFALLKRVKGDKLFSTGDSSKPNMKYISSLEYDEFGSKIMKFQTDKCMICFSRDYIQEYMIDSMPEDLKGNEFYIGNEGDKPIIINEDSGLDRSGRTIYEIILANLPDQYRSVLASIKAPKQTMYVEAKMAGVFLPIIVIFLTWIGLSKTLNCMGINYKFRPEMKRIPADDHTKRYIKFADGVLEYEPKIYAELILNGMSKLVPEAKTFKEFDDPSTVDNFIFSAFGTYNGVNELRVFYEFLMDPITAEVCRDMMLPTKIEELMIHAVKLLADNSFVSKVDDRSYRVRSIEIIPAILYSALAHQYKSYTKSGGRIPMTLKQNAIISKLIEEQTVEEYSTLNPAIEMTRVNTISTKGYRGSNSDFSYDKEKRSYHPTSIGKLSVNTAPDGNVGISRNLVVEPTIKGLRGYRDPVENINELKDVNCFDPTELLTPGMSRNDDSIRVSIANKQSGHVVPVIGAQASLISNGFDEAVQYHLSDDFVINADEDGEIVSVNPDTGFIVARYKSGKTRAITTNPDIVKNSGGGFYLSNKLTPVYAKVGDKFKKDEVLAYHTKYFTYSKLSGLRYAIGPIAKVAVMSTYNTYEDAGFVTEKFADKMKTSIVYHQPAPFKHNANIITMKEIGDQVAIGDPLIKYDTSFEDKEIMKYLSKLTEDNKALLEEETKNEVKATHAGTIIDIKIYTLMEPSNLSPSLGKIVQMYFDKGNMRKEYLNGFDDSPGIVKAGYIMRDNTEPVVNRYNMIKSYKGIDVLIEFYIEHDDVLGVGDKVALYSANKQVVSEVCPRGLEPYSEFRPDEQVDVLTSPGTVARRMTRSTITTLATGKVLVELKRRIKDIIKISK